jgi:hypothetical protein
LDSKVVNDYNWYTAGPDKIFFSNMSRLVFLLTIAVLLKGVDFKHILLCSISDYSHLSPLLKIAQDIKKYHNVTICSTPNAESIVRQYDTHFLPVGRRYQDSKLGEKGKTLVDIKKSIDAFFTPTTLTMYEDIQIFLKNKVSKQIILIC